LINEVKRLIKNNITKFSDFIPNKNEFCNEFIALIYSLLSNNSRIIQVSGNSGSGKSTFVQYLVGHLISNKKNLLSALWINTGSPFSDKRLGHNFNEAPEQLEYIKNNIFLTNISSYFKQQNLINELSSLKDFIPLNTKLIIFDSISYNFRLKLMKFNEINIKIKLINSFFTEQIYPLQMFASLNRVNLIFIHEVSYKPKLNKNIKFLHKMFNRIDSIMIKLEINEKRDKILNLKYHNIEFDSKYNLSNNGFEFII